MGSLFHPLCAFTDDTVLTVATAHTILTGTPYVEEAIRLAVSLGGDADTQAAIAGGIAEAYYGSVPESIVEGVWERLPARFIEVIDAFRTAFPVERKP